MSDKRIKKSKKGTKPKTSVVKNPNEPFVLTYDSRHYSRWCDVMTIKAKIEYGLWGQMCKTGTKPAVAEIDPDDYPNLISPNLMRRKIAKSMLQADISERQKTVARMNTDGPKLYSLLLQYLSPESLAQVMEHDSFDSEEDVDDPVKLWNAIRLTHRAGSDAVSATEQKTQTRIALNVCKQGFDEALHSFYKRWKEAYDAYEDAGNAVLKEEDQASSFLAALNDVAYVALKTQLHNYTVSGIAVPTTVADAYHHAAKFVIVRKSTKSSYGAAFTTIGESQEKRDEPKEKKKNSKNYKGVSNTEKRLRALEEKLKLELAAVLVGKEKPKEDANMEKAVPPSLSRAGSETGGGRRRPGPCWECGQKGHIAIDCPDRLDSDEGGDDDSSDEEDS